MGIRFSGRSRTINLTVLGLDGAGKTTLIERLHHNCFIETSSTRYFQYYEFTVRTNGPLAGVNLRIWDLSGREGARFLWTEFLASADVLLYVVDVSNTESIEESAIELERVLLEPRVRRFASTVTSTDCCCCLFPGDARDHPYIDNQQSGVASKHAVFALGLIIALNKIDLVQDSELRRAVSIFRATLTDASVLGWSSSLLHSDSTGTSSSSSWDQIGRQANFSLGLVPICAVNAQGIDRLGDLIVRVYRGELLEPKEQAFTPSIAPLGSINNDVDYPDDGKTKMESAGNHAREPSAYTNNSRSQSVYLTRF